MSECVVFVVFVLAVIVIVVLVSVRVFLSFFFVVVDCSSTFILF